MIVWIPEAIQLTLSPSAAKEQAEQVLPLCFRKPIHEVGNVRRPLCEEEMLQPFATRYVHSNQRQLRAAAGPKWKLALVSSFLKSLVNQTQSESGY